MSDLDKTLSWKLSKFEESIMRSVREKCDAVQSEVDDYKSQELQKYTDDIVTGNRERIDDERAGMERMIVRELSEKRTEYRKRLIETRERYTRTIFDSVERNLLDFCKSEEYLNYLKSVIKKAFSELPAGDVLILLKECDMRFTDELLKLCEGDAVFKADKDIEIGGAIVVNETEKMRCDYTLDARLSEQKRNFYSTSGCVIDF